MTLPRGFPILVLLLGGAGALWAVTSQPAAKAPAVPQRIVSINLCADQLVLALADRSQIAGLTKNATDREMSGEAAAARGLPLLSNSAEQILAIEPDLIVGMPASRSTALAALPAEMLRCSTWTPPTRSMKSICRSVRPPPRSVIPSAAMP